jgi:hypothetical protein
MIETDHLCLVPCTREHLEAFARSHGELGSMIGATVPESFPVMPEGFAYWLDIACRSPLPVGWANWIFIHKADRVAIGDGGFKGAPDERGEVEIGYAIIRITAGRALPGKQPAHSLAGPFRIPKSPPSTRKPSPRARHQSGCCARSD